MQLGYIGLGKMGLGMVHLLVEKGHDVTAWNRSPEPRQQAQKFGANTVDSVAALIQDLPSPRIIWLMLPAGQATQTMAHILLEQLQPGDTVIDGSNSFYKSTQKLGHEFVSKKIHFMDVGVSGGPTGARKGACLMIGGQKQTFQKLEPLFQDLAAPQAYQFFEGIGAGHFVKMVHNGIEYGMMQALAEGFNLMKESEYDLNLIDVARIYNHRSVIESRLVGWLHQAFVESGVDLKEYTGTVGHLGEGQWTVEDAQEKGIPLKIIAESLQFRIDSETHPSYTGKILQALRTAFGGKRGENDKPYT